MATRLMFSDKIVGYDRKLGLTTSETRRLIRSDIIEVFLKFLRYSRMLRTILGAYFTLSQSGFRGHSYKLCKLNFILHIRKFSISVRVINIRNVLQYSVLQCNTVNTFKRHLDLCLKNWGYL